MSWNKVIDNINREVKYRLRNTSEDQAIVIIDLCLVLDSDGVPVLWTVESKRLHPGHKAKEIVLNLPNPVDILSQI